MAYCNGSRGQKSISQQEKMKRCFHIISEKHKSRFNDSVAVNISLRSFLSGKGQHDRLNKKNMKNDRVIQLTARASANNNCCEKKGYGYGHNCMQFLCTRFSVKGEHCLGDIHFQLLPVPTFYYDQQLLKTSVLMWQYALEILINNKEKKHTHTRQAYMQKGK